MKSEIKTVVKYLASLPKERREAITAVRNVILENLPEGYEEAINWGMITYQVPLSVYPDTYNKQPLMYAALASQKNHMSVYLTGIYGFAKLRDKFEAEYKATGKRFDAGKSCVRFRKLEDLPIDFIGRTIAEIQMNDFVEFAKKIQSRRKKTNVIK